MTNANAAPLAVAALVEQLGRQVQAQCFTPELAPVQWSALRYFGMAGPAARTVSGLAAYSGVNVSSASRTIRLLVGKGLVSISNDPADNRIRRVSLSDRGRDFLSRDPLGKLAEALAALDAAEQVALRDLLARVLFQLCPKPF